MAPDYVSTGPKVLIALSCLNTQTLQVAFNLTPKECQGVFLNPCLDTSFPHLQKSQELFYPENTKNDCTTFQLSKQYLLGKNTSDPCALITGCTNFYFLKYPLEKRTRTKVSFVRQTQLVEILSNKPTMFGDAGMMFASTLLGYESTLTPQTFGSFSCAENTSEIEKFHGKMPHTSCKPLKMVEREFYFKETFWHKGLNLFSLVDAEDLNSSTNLFSFNVNISSSESKPYMNDSIFMNMISTAKLSLTLKFLGAEESEFKLPTMILNWYKTDCLMKPVKGVVQRNHVIEIACVGKEGKDTTCPTGEIKFKSNLCLEIASGSRPNLFDKVLFRWCNPFKWLYEYRMSWESEFDHDLFSLFTKCFSHRLAWENH